MLNESAISKPHTFFDFLIPGHRDFSDCFDDALVKNIKLFKKSRTMEITLSSGNLISTEVLEKAENRIAEEYGLDRINFIINYNINKPFNDLLDEFWADIVSAACKNDPGKRILLKDSLTEFTDNTLKVCLKTSCSEILYTNRYDVIISNLIRDSFNKRVRVSFEGPDRDEDSDARYTEKKQSLEDEIVKRTMVSMPKIQPDEGPVKNDGIILGKKINDLPVTMKSINMESGSVTIQGEVISLDFREIRNDRYICLFDVTDKTNSLSCRFFFKKDKYHDIKSMFKEGDTFIITGEVQYDKYARDMSIMAKNITRTGSRKLTRIDSAEIKRVELHMHTKMSAMDGMTEVDDLIERAHQWGHKAIAITDHGVVQAYPGASKIAKKLDIKVIYGIEGYLVDDEGKDDFDYTKAPSYHFIILVKNKTGLKNLYKLVSESHIDKFYKRPRITKSMVKKHREGLILGTACEAGELYKALIEKKSDEDLNDIVDFYDYLEIQPLGNNKFLIENRTVTGVEELRDLNRQILDLGRIKHKPVAATCDVHFLDPEDEIFRRILMAGQGYSDADDQAPLYLRTTEEMLEEFSYLGRENAYEVVVKNTNLINDMIENITPMPEGTYPPKIEGAEDEIKNISVLKAREIYGDKLHNTVEERLNKELNSIIKNGFSVMYLIASKLVQKSLSDGYLVGSRGSVGSSLVAYLTGITEVNPLPAHYLCKKCKYTEFCEDSLIDCGYDLEEKTCPECGSILKKDGYDIPFETFLGFDGDKEPDIDLNFSGEYQSTAHKYVEELFGKGCVFRAGTISSVADKTAFGFAKGYLDERTLITTNAELARLVKGCTGVKRTTGQHPGGVMIIPQDMEVYDFTPVQRPADDTQSDVITTHFDYDFLHGSILKLDILGHDDPTIIRMLEDMTGIDARNIPIGDETTMKIFSGTDVLNVSCDEINSEVATFGIPEFGTKFVRQMLVDTRPSTMSELIRISGLSHGTDVWINNASDLIKKGIADLSEVICTRDDIMLFLIHAGLPPLKAFKIMEDVRKGKGLTEEYEQLMKEHEVPSWYVDSCRKIKYMFPKAHAAAYVMMAFRIAWFKVNYPLEFYATYFTVKADEFDAQTMIKDHESIKEAILSLEDDFNNLTQKDKNVLTLLEIINEMYARGIYFHKVDLYRSDAVKFLIEDGRIRPPLNALPGLGQSAALRLAKERQIPFASVEDLKVRGKISKTVIEILQQQGCLETLPQSSQISFF